MKIQPVFTAILLAWLTSVTTFPAQGQSGLPKLLVRVDDIGMNHSTNVAIRKLAESGIPFSTSVLFVCPWYQETVEILKAFPHVTVGVHLALNAEWKYYRWGPVLGQMGVPSLVDSLGFFRSSIAEFLDSNYKLEDVEAKLSAQIERALGTGLKISYVDCHMGTALSTPGLRAIVERLAMKYKLGISTYFDEKYKTMWGVPVDVKKQEFLEYVNTLTEDKVNLVEIHIAQQSPEMDVLVDMNSSLMNSSDGAPRAGAHRQTELNMLLSPEFRSLAGKKFALVTYDDVIRSNGLDSMAAPTH